MEPPRADRFTFASDDVWLSEFRLLPGAPSWNQTSRTTDLATLIAFPRTSVAIRHEGRAEVVADPTAAVVYNAGQAYRRRVIAPQGDDCTVLAITRDVAAAGATEFDGRAADPDAFRLPFVAAPVGQTQFMALEHIRRAAARATPTERDAMREELFWILAALMRNGYAAHDQRTAGARPSTQSEHLSLTHAVRERLGRSLGHGPSLDELAAEVAASPFHLARVFRQATGRPIHAYLTELRLRASLAPIADGVRLADVAQQLGFASHAHLTERFTRAYGVSPMEWRSNLRMRFRPTSKNVEARPGGAFLA